MASEWTAVLSRARAGDRPVRELESVLVRRLAEEVGLDVLEVPHVYDLRDGDAALAALRALAGPMVVMGWLYPRALCWLLAGAGIEGVRISPGDTAKVANGRPIMPVDLRGACCADPTIDLIRALLSPAPARKGTVTRFDETVPERWYPVIDYDRCVNCLECLEFCLFGVYDADEAGRVTAADPDRCKPGCPACSRVCPQAAIMFPHHAGTPAIAGADEGRIEPLSTETIRRDGIAKECIEAAERLLGNAPCPCQAGDNAPDPQADASQPDPLDRAIDELDASEV